MAEKKDPIVPAVLVDRIVLAMQRYGATDDQIAAVKKALKA